MDFAVLVDHRVKIKENEKRDNYLDLARELKNAMNREYLDYSIVKIGHNIEKSPWDSSERPSAGAGAGNLQGLI